MVNKTRNTRKNALSMAEALLTLGVIGVLSVITASALLISRPDPNAALFKKAFYVTERITSELIHDDEIYPQSFNYPGLMNDKIVPTENGKPMTGSITGTGKFCTMFARKINASGTVDCNSTFTFTDKTVGNGNFRTADGVFWSFPIGTFANKNSTLDIVIDTNGSKVPNCCQGTTGSCKADCKFPDRFTITVVGSTGKIRVKKDSIEERYLKASSAKFKIYDDD